MLKSLPLLFVLAAGTAAATPAAMLQDYVAAVRKSDPAFTPAVSRGEALFRKEHAGQAGRASCAACHTDDPKKEGRTRAHKAIAPLAPAANPERFTDTAKTEKWFGRNCQDVVGRACTPAEKADFVTWLISIR
ncbi:MAG: hypothetical protein A2045_17095 [Rhodocyclales bacterium GWA2_65_20]|nr:MAG: hypothetical protein A2045_17095 [Rhodocyclales bacterium GWA2_65_20]